MQETDKCIPNIPCEKKTKGRGAHGTEKETGSLKKAWSPGVLTSGKLNLKGASRFYETDH
jgi:hypothetical protein